MTEPTRRQALHVAGAGGLAAVSAASLAGCGSGEAGAAASTAVDTAKSAAASAASSGASAASEAVAGAITSAEIPVGGGKIIDSLKAVITQPTAGDFKAFSSMCTHQGCPVTSVSEGTINCACHGSKFDIATGAVKAGPATSPLPTKSIQVGADGISVT